MKEQGRKPKKKVKTKELPEVPDKLYFGIKEVSELCAIKPHVLRYWEQEFSQLRPVKGQGNRRHYQPKDIHLIRRIRWLLYDEGFTISGARYQLQKDKEAQRHSRSESNATVDKQAVIRQLEQVVEMLEQ